MEERPIPCSSCKRRAEILYKEISEEKVTCYKMCRDCPQLLQKLGNPVQDQGLICDNCHSNFHSFIMGEGFGCPRCYTVFEDLLIQELKNTKAIPALASVKKKKTFLHFGKSPTLFENKDVKIKIETLQLALNEALAMENYELAANIRDQITALMGGRDGK